MPIFNLSRFFPLIAVVKNKRSPQTIGQECPNPGISVFHFKLWDSGTFQTVGIATPSAIPDAPGPLNCGQLMVFSALTGVKERKPSNQAPANCKSKGLNEKKCSIEEVFALKKFP
jgi:hypothetical protein